MTDEQERCALKDLIRSAFANVVRPGNWALCGSYEGYEGQQAAEAFGAIADWQSADAAFLRKAHGWQLGFLSHEGFRYFLPAFLLADLDALLGRADIVGHLIFELRADQRDEPVNQRRFGARTWFDEARYKFATFTRTEAAAILEYLKWKRANVDAEEAARIDDALSTYWLHRATS